ncbi:MAG: hypothetical protein AB1716_23840 [Planctomycetota bacterium]
MNRIRKVAALMLVAAAFAFAGLGCKTGGKSEASEQPKAAQPAAEQPKGEHPKGEHPEHPKGEHPK